MASVKEYTPSGKSKLKPEVKAAWLAALRDGRKQFAGALKGKREDGRVGYCCLGVLCDLGKRAKDKWEISVGFMETTWLYDDHEAWPPNYVYKKSGLCPIDAGILAEMNDNSIGLKRIANWIEKYL